MNALYLTCLNDKSKAGYFRSIISRIEGMYNYNKDYYFEIYSFRHSFSKDYLMIRELIKKPIDNSLLLNNIEYNYNNIKINYIFKEKNIINSIFSRKKLKSEIDFFYNKLLSKIDISKFDIVISHSAYPNGAIAMKIKENFDIPYITVSHGSDIHSLKNEALEKLTTEVLNLSDENIFVSYSLVKHAQLLGYKNNNYTVLPNGLDTKKFKIIDNYNLKKEMKLYNKVVGFVGNLEINKRADKLPEIFYNIKKSYENVDFLVIGDWRNSNVIKNECNKLNLNVKFMGRVDPEKVPYYMNAMDVLILPSRNEGWPCVVLEANACGLPVTGSDNGGIPEAISNYGVIVNEGLDFEKRFAQKVVECLSSNYDKHKLRNRALNYDWNEISKKEYDLYKKVIKNKSVTNL